MGDRMAPPVLHVEGGPNQFCEPSRLARIGLSGALPFEISSVRPGLYSSTVRTDPPRCLRSPLEPLCALSARGCLSFRARHQEAESGRSCLGRARWAGRVFSKSELQVKFSV